MFLCLRGGNDAPLRSAASVADIGKRIVEDLRRQGITPEFRDETIRFSNRRFIQSTLNRYILVNNGKFVIKKMKDRLRIEFELEVEQLFVLGSLASIVFTFFNFLVNSGSIYQSLGIGLIFWFCMIGINLLALLIRNWFFLRRVIKSRP